MDEVVSVNVREGRPVLVFVAADRAVRKQEHFGLAQLQFAVEMHTFILYWSIII